MFVRWWVTIAWWPSHLERILLSEKVYFCPDLGVGKKKTVKKRSGWQLGLAMPERKHFFYRRCSLSPKKSELSSLPILNHYLLLSLAHCILKPAGWIVEAGRPTHGFMCRLLLHRGTRRLHAISLRLLRELPWTYLLRKLPWTYQFWLMTSVGNVINAQWSWCRSDIFQSHAAKWNWPFFPSCILCYSPLLFSQVYITVWMNSIHHQDVHGIIFPCRQGRIGSVKSNPSKWW